MLLASKHSEFCKIRVNTDLLSSIYKQSWSTTQQNIIFFLTIVSNMVLLIKRSLCNGDLRKNSSWHTLNPHKIERLLVVRGMVAWKNNWKNNLIHYEAFRNIKWVCTSELSGLIVVTRIPDSSNCLRSYVPSALFGQRTMLFLVQWSFHSCNLFIPHLWETAQCEEDQEGLTDKAN